MNLPNKLTLGRIICVPFFIFLYITEYYFAALVIFIAASITDYFDGMLARKNGLVTNFGKIMDPLADKILVYSAFCLMVEESLVSAWILIVILAREFLVAGMRTVAASEGIVIAADMSGKIKTVLQMITVPVLILYKALEDGPFADKLYYAGMALLFASLFMTVFSGIEYIMKNKDVFSE